HVANLQSAAFYPLFWFWNLTGLTDWFFVIALLHGVLAAIGFYLWLKALKVTALPATLCALSFAGSAYLVHYWGFPTHLASVAWVPWLFWATIRLLEKPSLYRGSLLSILWALQILAGYPFFTFYAGLFLWVCARWLWKANIKAQLLIAGAFLAALGLTACQWLPFLDFLGYLKREGWGENLFSMRWVNYLTVFQPDLLGIPGTAGYRGDYPNYIFNNLYLGLVPLGLFVRTLLPSAQSRTFFWKGAALFWFFWLAGIHFFPLRLLPARWLDMLEPSKASFLFIFCVFTSLAVNLQEKADVTVKKSPVWNWAWVLGALWFLDLLWVPARVIHTVPDPYRAPEVTQAVQKARQWTGDGRLVSLRTQNEYYSGEVNDLAGSMKETAADLISNTNVVWGLKSARGYLSIYTDGFQNLRRYLEKGFPYDSRVLDAAGVKLVVFFQSLSAFKYQIHEPVGAAVFTRNAGAMGNAWVVDKIREFSDRIGVFEALLNPKAFLENEVYTEKEPDGKAVHLPPPNRSLAGVESSSLWDRLVSFGKGLLRTNVEIQTSRPSPCEARFEITASRGGGFLVFDESFAPGWRAWVDGKPQTIFRAYGLWMTTPLGEVGTHQVVFRYEPVAFRLGLFLSLISMGLGMVGLLGFAAKRSSNDVFASFH
ncbi:MAG TPA: YfhO family protein, partial [bacterium]